MDERTYHNAVAAWLADSFTHVEHEVRLPLPPAAPGEFVVADFIAHTPFESYVIEVENHADDIEVGVGQALRFAELTGHTPVVVLPPDQCPQQTRYGPVYVETV